MCLICATTAKISSIISKLRVHRKRARIFKLMQQEQQIAVRPAITKGIETYNFTKGERR